MIPVPQATAAVASANAMLPRKSQLNAPAHITLVYPFMPPPLQDDVIGELHDFFGQSQPMSFTLEIGWFGREVLLLRPHPEEDLISLTEALVKRWPEYPYYGGAYDTIDPHLSLGFGDGTTLEPVAAAVEHLLPVHVVADRAALLIGPHDAMVEAASFRLGRP